MIWHKGGTDPSRNLLLWTAAYKMALDTIVRLPYPRAWVVSDFTQWRVWG